MKRRTAIYVGAGLAAAVEPRTAAHGGSVSGTLQTIATRYAALAERGMPKLTPEELEAVMRAAPAVLGMVPAEDLRSVWKLIRGWYDTPEGATGDMLATEQGVPPGCDLRRLFDKLYRMNHTQALALVDYMERHARAEAIAQEMGP